MVINPPNFVVGNPWCDECHANHPIGSHLYPMCAECMVRHREDLHSGLIVTFTETKTVTEMLNPWLQLALDKFKPTANFRWLEGQGVNTLQQQWVAEDGSQEWRDIPVEKAHVENQG